jgi:hypothetical protein
MKRTRTLVTILGLGILSLAIGLGHASHAAIPAMAGNAQNPGLDTCFSNSFGTVTNNCSGVQQWCVSSFISNAGTHSVRVDAMRPNGGSLTCTGVSVNEFGGVVSSTGPIPLNVVNIDTALTVGNVSVPGFGSLYVCCDLSTGARVDTLNF